jgi:Fur family ferric uptake transcriptional regulator
MTRRIPDQDLEDGKDELRVMLWMKRLKATPGRIVLLEALEKEKSPVSVLEIEKKLSASKSAVSLGSAAIYRALETLVKARLVSKINTGKVHSSYEMIFGRKHHHHAVCTSCGLMEDVSVCDADDLNTMARVHLKNFKSIQSHSLEFFGLCKKCEEKQTE